MYSLSVKVLSGEHLVRVKKTFHYYSVRNQRKKLKKVYLRKALFLIYLIFTRNFINSLILIFLLLEPSYYDDEEEEEEKPKKKVKAVKTKPTKTKSEPDEGISPTKRKKKTEDDQEVWKWYKPQILYENNMLSCTEVIKL